MNKELSDNIIKVNDTIKVKNIFNGEEGIEIFTLVDYSDGYVYKQDLGVSINSPYGKAILGQEVGSTVPYKVNNITNQVTILEKLNEKNKQLVKKKSN